MIEWAPGDIPLSRRLQTLAILKWTCCFLFLPYIGSFIILYLLFSQYWYLAVLYGVWYYHDQIKNKTPETGGRPVEWIRSWKLWDYYRDYFPISLHKTTDLDPDKNYIFAFHPHGIMVDGAFCNFATNATGFRRKFPGLRPILLVLGGQFQFPLHREYFMNTGACSCSKKSIRYLLNSGTGKALVLVTGGASEALEAKPGNYKLNLKKRKGFIKLAIENGVNIVPVFSFGEIDIYDQIDNPEGSLLRKFQTWMQQFTGFSLPAFKGRGIFQYSFGLLPRRQPIDTVVGAPIDVTKNPSPSQEEVEELHTLYMEKLVELFNENKVKYGLPEDKELEIF